MQQDFDIKKFNSYREDNRREVKKARGGLPVSLWDTYSAFANCHGGVIILGVVELDDGRWKTTGLKSADKLLKDFWNTINNQKKVSINLLSEDDVEIYNVGDDVVMVIYVPMARREYKPVYINGNLFGEEYRIVREYPEYFLDYREVLDPTIRWTDRLQSSSGEWSGNLFDFYFRVYNKIIKNVKVPFLIVGGDRIDDTAVHRALREVLANCLVNADFFMPRGVVIQQMDEVLILENPGSIRVGKYQMMRGGESDPRNKALMKMFNMIGIGERAGSGVPELLATWENQGWEKPCVDERLNHIERTVLTLSFKKKVLKKSAEKKVLKKTQEHYKRILSSMESGVWYRSNEFMEILDMKETRLRALFKELAEAGLVEADGSTKGKKYRKI